MLVNSRPMSMSFHLMSVNYRPTSVSYRLTFMSCRPMFVNDRSTSVNCHSMSINVYCHPSMSPFVIVRHSFVSHLWTSIRPLSASVRHLLTSFWCLWTSVQRPSTSIGIHYSPLLSITVRYNSLWCLLASIRLWTFVRHPWTFVWHPWMSFCPSNVVRLTPFIHICLSTDVHPSSFIPIYVLYFWNHMYVFSRSYIGFFKLIRTST